MNVQAVCIVLFIFLVATKSKIVYEKTGNLTLAIYLSLCLQEASIDSSMLIEAVDYQVRVGNSRLNSINSKRKHHVAFGYQIYDTCYSEPIAAEAMINLADQVGLPPDEGNCCKSRYSASINTLGVIANLTGDYTNLVVHSFLPSKQNFLDLSLDSPSFPLSTFYRYRHIGEGGKVFEMFEKIIKELEMKNIGIIISDSTYGRKGYADAINFLSDTICSLSYYFMPEDETQMSELMTVLKRSYHLDAIILWLTGSEALTMLKSADKYGLHNQTWISGSLVSLMPVKFFQNISASVLKGMIVTAPDNEDRITKDFLNHFWKYSKHSAKDRPWLYKTLDSLKKRTTAELFRSLQGSTFGYVDYLMNGIYIMTNEVYATFYGKPKMSFKYLMRTLRNKQLVKYNVYKIFYAVDYFFVNTFRQLPTNLSIWELKELASVKVTTVSSSYFVSFKKSDFWTSFVFEKSPSLCNQNCLPGYHRVDTHGTCCYLCKKCEDGYYAVVNSSIHNDSCVKCPENSESNANRTFCMFYQDVFVGYNSMEAYVTYFLSAFGSFLTLVAIVCFIIHIKTPVVKSSNVKLSLVQLLAHLCLFIHPVLYFGEQTERKCSTTVTTMGLLATTIVAIVFAKTCFFLQVFKQKTVVEKPIIGKMIQYICIGTVLLIYCCIVAVIFNLSVEVLVVTSNKATLEKHIGCGHGALVLAICSYNLLLLFICMVLAFKARNLPSYFNETKLIFYASFLSFLLMGMAGLLVISMNDIRKGLLLKVGTLFTFNICILMCLYTWKVWMILFKPEHNTKEKLRTALFNTAKENVAVKFHRRHDVEHLA